MQQFSSVTEKLEISTTASLRCKCYKLPYPCRTNRAALWSHNATHSIFLGTP